MRIEETATPLLSYPFADDMEGPQTAANWLSSSWELITTDFHSPTHSWTDSPQGPTPSHSPGSSLTLAGVIDLTGAECPQLSFWQSYGLAGNNRGYLEGSTNYGHDWVTLGSWTGTASWTQTQVSLAEYAGSYLRVRFRIGTSSSGVGWSNR